VPTDFGSCRMAEKIRRLLHSSVTATLLKRGAASCEAVSIHSAGAAGGAHILSGDGVRCGSASTGVCVEHDLGVHETRSVCRPDDEGWTGFQAGNLRKNEPFPGSDSTQMGP
jgi:hypothetical protein